MISSQELAIEILALLKSGMVDISLERFPAGVWGGHDFDDDGDDNFVSIAINHRLCFESKIRVLIHESIHLLRHRRNEKWVRAKEDEIYALLTKAQRKTLEKIVKKLEAQKQPKRKASRSPRE